MHFFDPLRCGMGISLEKFDYYYAGLFYFYKEKGSPIFLTISGHAEIDGEHRFNLQAPTSNKFPVGEVRYTEAGTMRLIPKTTLEEGFTLKANIATSVILEELQFSPRPPAFIPIEAEFVRLSGYGSEGYVG